MTFKNDIPHPSNLRLSLLEKRTSKSFSPKVLAMKYFFHELLTLKSKVRYELPTSIC